MAFRIKSTLPQQSHISEPDTKSLITALLSSDNKNIDVSKIALKLNGGGHKMAAGCILETTNVDEAKKQILNLIKSEG